jgi:hypothetical protein
MTPPNSIRRASMLISMASLPLRNPMTQAFFVLCAVCFRVLSFICQILVCFVTYNSPWCVGKLVTASGMNHPELFSCLDSEGLISYRLRCLWLPIMNYCNIQWRSTTISGTSNAVERMIDKARKLQDKSKVPLIFRNPWTVSFDSHSSKWSK